MNFSISGFIDRHAQAYAQQQVPAVVGQENNPNIIHGRRRFEYMWKVRAHNVAAAAIVTSVALAIFLSTKVFLLTALAGAVIKQRIYKTLTVNNVQPAELEYKNILREWFGIHAGEMDAWARFTQVNKQPEPLYINQLPLALEPRLPVAPAQEQPGGLVNNVVDQALEGAPLAAAAVAAQRRQDAPIVPQPGLVGQQEVLG